LPSKLRDEMEFVPAGEHGIHAPFDSDDVMFVQLAVGAKVPEGAVLEYPSPWHTSAGAPSP